MTAAISIDSCQFSIHSINWEFGAAATKYAMARMPVAAQGKQHQIFITIMIMIYHTESLCFAGGGLASTVQNPCVFLGGSSFYHTESCCFAAGANSFYHTEPLCFPTRGVASTI